MNPGATAFTLMPRGPKLGGRAANQVMKRRLGRAVNHLISDDAVSGHGADKSDWPAPLDMATPASCSVSRA